jgi:hypothetical protein
MSAEVHPKSPILGSRRALQGLFLAVVFVGVAGGLAFACGGTTGRPDTGETPTPTGEQPDGGMDSTVVIPPTPIPDAGLFDVVIQYADRVLPDVSVPGEGGSEAGYPWPNCPPWVKVNAAGAVVPLIRAGTWVVTEYDDTGMVVTNDAGTPVPAPDGSPCATYPWYGSAATDQCLNAVLYTVGDPARFPPCSWCVDAGTVMQGSRLGDQRFTVCEDLYLCMLNSGCAASGDPATCLCGTESSAVCQADHNPPGPCASQEMAALEEIPGDTSDALQNYLSGFGSSALGVCGSELNSIFDLGNSNQCFPLGDQ